MKTNVFWLKETFYHFFFKGGSGSYSVLLGAERAARETVACALWEKRSRGVIMPMLS